MTNLISPLAARPSRTVVAATLCLAMPLSALAEGDSPWLPIPGDLSVSVNLTQQSGKSAYIGSTELPITAITGGAASKVTRSTTQLRLAYGLSDSLSVDASVGNGQVKVGRADDDKGRTDSAIGLNWRVLDEFESPGLPSLTFRAAAILKGSYDGGRLAALGNDANGVALAVLLGKQLSPAVAVWAEAGLQNRSDQVPNATYYGLNGRFNVSPQWSVSLGVSSKKYGGDLDIGGPGFSPSRFQQVRAERTLVKAGVAWALAGNQGLSLNLAKVTSGRNTVKDDSLLALSYTYAF
jgi:hypothetical protein